jgi:hypothetical protein
VLLLKLQNSEKGSPVNNALAEGAPAHGVGILQQSQQELRYLQQQQQRQQQQQQRQQQQQKVVELLAGRRQPAAAAPFDLPTTPSGLL